MNRVTGVHLVTPIGVVIAHAVRDTNGHLDRIGSIGASIVVPATAPGIQLASKEWQNGAIGCGGICGAALSRQNADLNDGTE